MRAALIKRVGPPQVLEIGEIPIPSLANNQVLVRVRATSVNPIDCGLRRGGLSRFVNVPFPIIPGVDLSGVVEKRGKDVRGFSEGDGVFGFIPLGRGANAEFAVCDESWLAMKPAGLNHIEAAVLPCVGLTALQGLRDKARLQTGQSVLIVGASGGVGTMAVQIACAMGVEVTGVCSSANVELVQKLGARRIINYTTHNPLLDTQRFDAVFDCIGKHSYWSYRKHLRRGGRHIGISCTGEAVFHSLLSQVLPGTKSFQFHVQAKRSDLELVTTLIAEGRLRPIVSHVYPLSDIAAAHRQCESRRTVGKIAITVG